MARRKGRNRNRSRQGDDHTPSRTTVVRPLPVLDPYRQRRDTRTPGGNYATARVAAAIRAARIRDAMEERNRGAGTRKTGIAPSMRRVMTALRVDRRLSKEIRRKLGICQKRTARKEVLFSLGIAGRSGGSPGPYKRDPNSKVRC